MKILFVASELTPIAKVGGLGDVIGALPKALKKLGLDISIIIPRYYFIDKKKLKLVKKNISISLRRGTEKIYLYSTVIPKTGIRVFLVENPTYLSQPPGPYFDSSAFVGEKKEIQRFVFFSKAVSILLQNNVLKTDIVHANDWHTGALVTLLAQTNAEGHADLRGKIQRRSVFSRRKSAIRPKTVFTIHNLANQGRWKTREIDNWLFSKRDNKSFKKQGQYYNFMAEGILNAGWITTVSPTYAKEILTRKYGAGLEKTLNARKHNLTGIINGIDYEFWNPEKDKFIFKNFSGDKINLKSLNKTKLQKLLGLKEDPNIPLFSLVARLTHQKGIDFISLVLEYFIKKFPGQFVFLGRGEKRFEKSFADFAQKFPKNIYTKIGFDEELAHKIYAASDFFLMPSRFEPSGLGQMIAMRYGAIPIVRDTGGLHDTVENLKTGFVFRGEEFHNFENILRLAWIYYQKFPHKISEIQKNCFEKNFDFSHSAQEYLKIYKKLLSK